MNNKYTFWWYEKAFPNYVCDKLIYYFEKQKENYRKGTVGKLDNKSVHDFSKQEMKELLDYRDSDIAWTEDQWLYNILFPFIKDANQKAGWNYQYDRAESVQFTNMVKMVFMIGTVILINNHMEKNHTQIFKVKLENFL